MDKSCTASDLNPTLYTLSELLSAAEVEHLPADKGALLPKDGKASFMMEVKSELFIVSLL